MKYIRAVLAMAALALVSIVDIAAAQKESPLSGRVVDEAGKPVVGALVGLVELGRATSTSETGDWSFGSTPAGTYHLDIRRLGYASVLRTVVAPATGTVVIIVPHTSLRLDPVTVTATRQASDPMRTPLPVATLNEEDLRREHSISLGRAVERLPGVRAVTTGEQIGKPMIRGLFGSRVLTLDNGSRLEDYSWSDEDAPAIESRLAQRIEVIRGPASVLYGSDAIGGVVNVIPYDLPDAIGRAAYRRVGAEVYGASNNKEVGGALRLDGASGAMGWRLFGVGRFASDFSTPRGDLQNTGVFVGNGDAAVGFRSSRGNTTVRVSHSSGEYHLLEAFPPATPPAGGDEGPVRKMFDERIQVSGNYSLGSTRLEPKLQFQLHNMSEVSDDLSGGSTIETEVFNLLLNTLSGDLLWHHAPNGNVRGTVGVSGLYQQSGSRGPRTIVPSADVNGAALFVFEEITNGQWSFLGGARADHRGLTAKSSTALALAGDSRSYNRLTGDVGMVFRPITGVAMAANVGTAWRAPTLFEMYANGPRIGENRFDKGSPLLEPEQSVNIDGSVRLQKSMFRGEVAAFRNLVRNYIFAYPTSEQENGVPVYRSAQADGEFVGGEVSAEALLTSIFTLRGKVDGVRGVNKGLADEPLPLVPPMRGSAEAELHTPSFSLGRDARLGLEVEHVAEQKRLSPYDTPTGAYTLVHVDAGLSRLVAGRDVRIDLRVRNAGNTAYTDYLSRYKLFALNPGRNVVLRLSTGF